MFLLNVSVSTLSSLSKAYSASRLKLKISYFIIFFLPSPLFAYFFNTKPKRYYKTNISIMITLFKTQVTRAKQINTGYRTGSILHIRRYAPAQPINSRSYRYDKLPLNGFNYLSVFTYA